MTLGSGKRCFSRVIVFFVLLFEIIPISVSLEARLSLKVDMDGGFHRTLKYRVEFDEPMKDCHTAIYLELPSALYVNVDELAELRRLGVVTACSVGETDVELFMEKAMPQNVCASSPITDSEATVKLPIHQRYQYAKDRGGYVTVTLPKPKLLLGCKERIREYRVSKIDLCSSCAKLVPKWREIPYIMASGGITGIIVFHVNNCNLSFRKTEPRRYGVASASGRFVSFNDHYIRHIIHNDSGRNVRREDNLDVRVEGASEKRLISIYNRSGSTKFVHYK